MLVAAMTAMLASATGCQSTKPSHVDGDLNWVLNDLDHRPELANKSTPTTEITLVMRGPATPPERLSDSTFGLGDADFATSRLKRGLSLGISDENFYMTTKEPIETFLRRAVVPALATRGITVIDAPLRIEPTGSATPSVSASAAVANAPTNPQGAPKSRRTLVVTLLRIWLDRPDMSNARGDLETQIEVFDTDSATPVYRRSVVVDAAVERNHFAGLISSNVDESLGRTIFHELFLRFQDDLFADDDFWKSLR